MEKELQRKIAWLEKQHEALERIVDSIENDRRLDRSNTAMKNLRNAKKEKLRIKDHLEWMRALEKKRTDFTGS